MFRKLSNCDQKDLLAMFEHIYSTKISEEVLQERDQRVPDQSNAYNVAKKLNLFSEEDLQRLIMSNY